MSLLEQRKQLLKMEVAPNEKITAHQVPKIDGEPPEYPSPASSESKVSRLRAMFEKLDQTAHHQPDSPDHGLYQSRRKFKSMVNVHSSKASSPRMETTTGLENSREASKSLQLLTDSCERSAEHVTAAVSDDCRSGAGDSLALLKSVQTAPEPPKSDYPPAAATNPTNTSTPRVVTLGERALSSQELDRLSRDGAADGQLDAIRRYFRGLDTGDIATCGQQERALLRAARGRSLPPKLSVWSPASRAASSPRISAGSAELGGPEGWSTSGGGKRSRRRLRAGTSLPGRWWLWPGPGEVGGSRPAPYGRHGIIVFGPGMSAGKVEAVNTFQLCLPEPILAPLGAHVYSRRPDAVTGAVVTHLHGNFHQVAYWASQPGWYRVHVTTAAAAADLQLMVKVTH